MCADVVPGDFMPVRTILFVDDDAATLRSLERTFAGSGFHVRLAGSVAEGLAAFVEGPVDIVFADIRMTPIDGLTLLRQIRERWPAAIRVALSAYGVRQTMLSTVIDGTAQLFVLKPWDDAGLVKLVERLFELYSVLRGRHLAAALSRARTVLILPDLYTRIKAAINNDKSAREIAVLFEGQPDIAARVLNLANASFYGVNIGSIKQALVYMGLETVKNLVLAAEYFAPLPHGSPFSAERECLIRHTSLVNRIVAALHLRLFEHKIADSYATAGLLVDIGRMLMLNAYGELYAPFISSPTHGGIPELLRSEEKRFGFNHTTAGAYLLDWWQLPAYFSEGAWKRYAPEEAGILPQPILALIQAADARAWSIIEKVEVSLEPAARLLGMDTQILSDLINAIDSDDFGIQ